MLSIREYRDKFEPYLNDLIADLEIQGGWKNQSTMAINFVSFKNSYESGTICLIGDDTKILIGYETYEFIL